MTIKEFREIYHLWQFTYRDHRMDFPDWVEAHGYQLESYVCYADEIRQKEWLKKMRHDYKSIFGHHGEVKNGI